MKTSDHKKALLYLSKDRKLKVIIEKYNLPDWNEDTDLFADIVESIINQQLSGKAAATIFGRFKNLFKTKTFPKPQDVLKVPDEKMRACGISYSKIKYIKGLCLAIIDKSLDVKKIPDLSDEEVIIELTKIKGIGRWTAEMILIFSLKRPDVFSTGDLGLRTAVSRLYKLDREDRVRIEKLAKKWSPHRSLASWYLWRSLENRS